MIIYRKPAGVRERSSESLLIGVSLELCLSLNVGVSVGRGSTGETCTESGAHGYGVARADHLVDALLPILPSFRANQQRHEFKFLSKF